MMPLLFRLKPEDTLAEQLCRSPGVEAGEIGRRQFPDGESYVRLMTPVAGRDVVLLCSLDNPDAVTLPLLFAADAARAQGALSVGLVAPYLAYMRQDKVFNPGEAVTSVTYARMLSSAFDWLVTVDPHLHRHTSLSDIYSIPGTAVTAADPIADWIRREVADPVIIGPDEESAQWVGRIAALAGVPFVVMEKARHGDRDVSITAAGLADFPRATPVIIDDIISSARTMVGTVGVLRKAGYPPPVCVGVHAIFADDAYTALQSAGPARIVTTNTISHASNAIDLAAILAPAMACRLQGVAAAGGLR